MWRFWKYKHIGEAVHYQDIALDEVQENALKAIKLEERISKDFLKNPLRGYKCNSVNRPETDIIITKYIRFYYHPDNNIRKKLITEAAKLAAKKQKIVVYEMAVVGKQKYELFVANGYLPFYKSPLDEKKRRAVVRDNINKYKVDCALINLESAIDEKRLDYTIKKFTTFSGMNILYGIVPFIVNPNGARDIKYQEVEFIGYSLEYIIKSLQAEEKKDETKNIKQESKITEQPVDTQEIIVVEEKKTEEDKKEPEQKTT